ncbi:MAG: hypothetical protein LR000_00840 [Candidatus Pacebacteria bacterium]|nr:hypothetical protein [Candidatus Paceibacterota bacterium]
MMYSNHYHSQSVEKIFELFQTSKFGLSQKEAKFRLKKFGKNKIPQAKKFSLFALFLRQFKNPLIYILFAALIISFLTKHLTDAGIILAVILISAIFGFFQECKTNKALLQLKKMIVYKARILREGKKTSYSPRTCCSRRYNFTLPW